MPKLTFFGNVWVTRYECKKATETTKFGQKNTDPRLRPCTPKMLTKLYTNPSRHVMLNTGSIWKKCWQFNACINLKNFYTVGISFYIYIPNLYQPSFSFSRNKWSTVVGREGYRERSPKHINQWSHLPYPTQSRIPDLEWSPLPSDG